MGFLELRPDSPVRPPDWRTQLASDFDRLRQQQIPTRPEEVTDPLVRLLLRHEYGWNLSGSEDDCWPIVAETLLWVQSASEQQLFELQARLLAGQTDAEIGFRLGLTPHIVHYYEQLFYCCRDRLHARSHVRNQFLNGMAMTPTLADVVRKVAYRYGVERLEEILEVINNDQLGRSIPQPTTPTESEHAIRQARIRVLLAWELLPRDVILSPTAQRMLTEWSEEPNRSFTPQADITVPTYPRESPNSQPMSISLQGPDHVTVVG